MQRIEDGHEKVRHIPVDNRRTLQRTKNLKIKILLLLLLILLVGCWQEMDGNTAEAIL